jgi:sugar phosphate isomerase/epimerase
MSSITRRKFVQNASLATLATALPNPLASFSTFVAQTSGPAFHFPTEPRERLAVASYPFRDFISGHHDEKPSNSPKMPLTDFPAHVVSKFNVKKIEPWSAHFQSAEPAYLDQLGNAAAKAGSGFADIAADGENSIYSPDPAERERAMQFSKRWIDVAARLASPSVRIHIAAYKEAKPGVTQVAESLKPIADYSASRNVVVHFENDDPISEDPFFIASLLDRINSPWLRALPDFGNSFAALPAEDALRGVDQMFARAYAICHVKDAITDPANKVIPVDIAKIFALVAKHNYKGIFSMEFDSEGDPYAGTTRLVAATLKNLP